MSRFLVEASQRLDAFLASKMPEHSRTKLARALAEHVRVDGLQRKPSFVVHEGMVVEVNLLPEAEAHNLDPVEMALTIEFEDEHLLVLDKPRGLTVHPAASERNPTLVQALLARSSKLSTVAGAYRPGIVHRLDKDTSGLLVVAKTDRAHASLAKQFQDKTAERRYVGRVWGSPVHDRFSIDAPIARDAKNRTKMCVHSSGRNARTHVKVLERFDATALIGARLDTGRTHQIRVHLASFGHPVQGDRIYATGSWSQGPLQLHAAFLRFLHPVSGDFVTVFCSPPNDFEGAAGIRVEQLDPW